MSMNKHPDGLYVFDESIFVYVFTLKINMFSHEQLARLILSIMLNLAAWYLGNTKTFPCNIQIFLKL